MILILLVFAAEPLNAQTENAGSRWEVTLNLSSWPAIGDLEPMAGGSFDTIGYGLAGAVHWPVRQFSDSELLLGIDGGLSTHGSSTSGILEELMTRHLFLSPSLKWVFGEKQRYSLDAGIGFHLLDIAEFDGGYGATGVEVEYWEETAVAPYIGATWDVNAGDKKSGGAFSIGIKVHFVDFGRVKDEDTAYSPRLGPDAGDLDGPIAVLQFGMSFR